MGGDSHRGCLARGEARCEYQVDEQRQHHRHNHNLEQACTDLAPFHPDFDFVHHPYLAYVLEHHGPAGHSLRPDSG